jgi:hypothetical protein
MGAGAVARQVAVGIDRGPSWSQVENAGTSPSKAYKVPLMVGNCLSVASSSASNAVLP